MLDVYFEEKIEILVADTETFSAEKAKEILEEAEVEFTTLVRSGGGCAPAGAAGSGD